MSEYQNALTRHHIIPRSRVPKGRDPNSEDNIAMVKRKYHEKYHALFNNRTPEEIMDFLVNYFWNGRGDFVINYMIDVAMKEVEDGNQINDPQ